MSDVLVQVHCPNFEKQPARTLFRNAAKSLVKHQLTSVPRGVDAVQ